MWASRFERGAQIYNVGTSLKSGCPHKFITWAPLSSQDAHLSQDVAEINVQIV